MDDTTKRAILITTGVALLAGVVSLFEQNNPPSQDKLDAQQSRGHGARNNSAHETLLQFNDAKRREAWTLMLQRSGESCGSVTKTFFQMQDDQGRAYWHVACKNGRAYSIRVDTDTEGSTKVMDCDLLKRLTGDGCFVRFQKLDPGWRQGW